MSDKLIIENTKTSGIVKVEFINAGGNTVIVQITNPRKTIITIPLQQLQTGIYLIRITNEDNSIVTNKIMKK